MNTTSLLANPAVWGLCGVVLTTVTGTFGIWWKARHEESSAKKREDIALSAATKAAEITAQTTKDERVTRTLEEQIRELRTELAAQKLASDTDMKALKQSYRDLNIEFDEERKKRREWETIADQNQRKIAELSERILRMEDEKRQSTQWSEETIDRQTAEIASLHEQVATITCERDVYKEQLSKYDPIGGGEKPK